MSSVNRVHSPQPRFALAACSALRLVTISACLAAWVISVRAWNAADGERAFLLGLALRLSSFTLRTYLCETCEVSLGLVCLALRVQLYATN